MNPMSPKPGAPVHRILLAPWQQRRNESGLAWLALIAAFVAVPLVVAKGLGAGVAIALAFAIGGTVLIGLWWMVVMNLLQQNDPVLARLLPLQLRRLRQAFACVVVVVSAAVGGGAGLCFGHGQAIAAGVAACLMFIAVCVRWPWIAIGTAFTPMLISALALTVPPLHLQLDPHPLVAIVQSPHFMPALLAIESLACVGLAHVLLMDGGEAHRRAHARLLRWASAWQAQMRGDLQARRAQLPGWLQRWLQQPYHEWMARLLRTDQGERGAMSRALMAFGPVAHWTGQLAGGLVMSVFMASIIVFIWCTRPPGHQLPMATAAWGPMIGMMSYALAVALQSHSNAHARRRELALMSLVPGLPQGGAFNRALAVRLGLHALIAWGVATLVLAVLFTSVQSDPRIPVAFSFGCLSFVTWAWKDWSRMAPATIWNSLLPVLLAVVGGGIGWGLYAWAGWPIGLIVAVGAGAAVMSGAWRWRRLYRAPRAWPVGRLAT